MFNFIYLYHILAAWNCTQRHHIRIKINWNGVYSGWNSRQPHATSVCKQKCTFQVIVLSCLSCFVRKLLRCEGSRTDSLEKELLLSGFMLIFILICLPFLILYVSFFVYIRDRGTRRLSIEKLLFFSESNCKLKLNIPFSRTAELPEYIKVDGGGILRYFSKWDVEVMCEVFLKVPSFF